MHAGSDLVGYSCCQLSCWYICSKLGINTCKESRVSWRGMCCDLWTLQRCVIIASKCPNQPPYMWSRVWLWAWHVVGSMVVARGRCTYEEWVWHIVWVWYIVCTHIKLGASMGVAHDICKHLQTWLALHDWLFVWLHARFAWDGEYRWPHSRALPPYTSEKWGGESLVLFHMWCHGRDITDISVCKFWWHSCADIEVAAFTVTTFSFLMHESES